MDITRLRQPRCFLVYALAPEDSSPADANRAFNAFVGDRDLPLVVYHDHFIGRPGGIAIFYAETDTERRALTDPDHLADWEVEVRPLIYSRSPSGFDEQTRFTQRAYRGRSWSQLRRELGDPWQRANSDREDPLQNE